MSMVSDTKGRVPPLFAELEKILFGDIDCSLTTLESSGGDGSPYFIPPQAVIFPKNTTDIKHVLSFAREFSMPIAVRGKGTKENGGSLGEGLIIDMSRYFSQVRTIHVMDHTVSVDAGVTIRELKEKLMRSGFELPLLRGVNPDSTIGGLVSTKSLSSSSFSHGTIREWVESLTLVVDNGEEHRLSDGITPSGRLLGIYQSLFPLLSQESPQIRASKPLSSDDATGYSLWNASIGPRQLIDQVIGSEGTFGIITSVSLRIMPRRANSITTCIPVYKRKDLPLLIELAKHHKAESIFLYDQTLMELSKRYRPDVVPYFAETPFVLLVTHSGYKEDKLHHIVQTFKNVLPVEEHLLQTLDNESNLQEILDRTFSKEMLNLYSNSTLVPNTSASGIIVRPHVLPQLLEEIEEYLESLGKIYTISGNVGSGQISLITLFDAKSRLYEEDLTSYTNKIFSIVKNQKGGVSAYGGDGLTKAPYMSYFYSEQMILVFKKIKEVWDPLLILNPGKKYGATLRYLNERLYRPKN